MLCSSMVSASGSYPVSLQSWIVTWKCKPKQLYLPKLLLVMVFSQRIVTELEYFMAFSQVWVSTVLTWP